MSQVISEMEICDAIADTFRQVGGLTVQSYNELTDGIPQTPLLQVYWSGFNEDPHQIASQMKVIGSDENFIADLYAAQRSELAEDIRATMHWVSKIRQIYYQQQPIYFGLEQIQAVTWQAQRTTLTYNDPNLRYAGARFRITVRVF